MNLYFNLDGSKKMISQKDCTDKHVYRCDARNFSVAIYYAKNDTFYGIRYKFGDKFIAAECHWDKGMAYGTVKPSEDIGLYSGSDDLPEIFKFLESLEGSDD